MFVALGISLFGKQVDAEQFYPQLMVAYFEKWVKQYKQLDCDKDADYYHLRNTLKKMGRD